MPSRTLCEDFGCDLLCYVHESKYEQHITILASIICVKMWLPRVANLSWKHCIWTIIWWLEEWMDGTMPDINGVHNERSPQLYTGQMNVSDLALKLCHATKFTFDQIWPNVNFVSWNTVFKAKSNTFICLWYIFREGCFLTGALWVVTWPFWGGWHTLLIWNWKRWVRVEEFSKQMECCSVH